jgi:hypothetical protein
VELEFKDLLEFLKTTLGDKVLRHRVRLSVVCRSAELDRSTKRWCRIGCCSLRPRCRRRSGARRRTWSAS